MAAYFAQPWALVLLAVVPFLGWLWRRRQQPAVVVPSLARGLERRGRRALAMARWGMALRLLGLAAGVVALSEPRWPDEGSRLPTEGISIMFVVDASHSMTAQDFHFGEQLVTRFDGVRHVFRLLVAGGTAPNGITFPGRPHDLLGLVCFATRPETACPLTLDHRALLAILDAESPRTVVTEATTNPGDALAWALASLAKAPTRRRVIILLTDGESNVPPPALRPLQAGQLAANLTVPVYAIDAAPDDDSPDTAKARATLQGLARLTHGRYFHATDAAALADALQTIDRLERDEIRSFSYRRYHETYHWFVMIALACWLVIIVSEATWWRAVP
ncbi:MAG: VWA domain-containing protein [Gemmataceae bacterium]|nr:VWA domain-containing protein [Gemmataceae bacterium]